MPDRTTVNYNLRSRPHNKTLIPKTSDLNERDFLIRNLYTRTATNFPLLSFYVVLCTMNRNLLLYLSLIDMFVFYHVYCTSVPFIL